MAYNPAPQDPTSPTDARYTFVDLQRSRPLVILAVLFGVAVIALLPALLAGGDTAPVTREVLREAEDELNRRPVIHVGG